MARKKRQSGSLVSRLVQFLLLVLAASLIGANWFVHKPRAWRDAATASWPPALTRRVVAVGHAFADCTDALGLSGSDVSVSLPVFTSPSGVAFAGAPRPIPGGPAPQDLVTLRKKAFTVAWSPSARHAVWGVYRIPPTEKPLDLSRPSAFSPDPAVPQAPKSEAYARSGYDRGHLVPSHAIASRFGREAQLETFLMSNIAPQRPWLNQGPWADVELRAANDWSGRYGDVWMTVGAILSPDPRPQKLAGGIGIPTAFYQIAVVRHRERLRACAVVMPQQISRRARPRAYLASIDEIEKLSGFDFFSALPDEEEARLEAGTATRLLPSGFGGLAAIIKRRLGIYPD